MNSESQYHAFIGQHLLGTGTSSELYEKIKNNKYQKDATPILCFELISGKQIDLDFRQLETGLKASVEAAGASLGIGAEPKSKRPRGRPKLGVIGREVTLLPRHWQWLEQQRGGVSATLRKLIEDARKSNVDEDLLRQAQDSANRFMYAMAGDFAGFEEAVRALYAGNRERFDAETCAWPEDIRSCTLGYASAALN